MMRLAILLSCSSLFAACGAPTISGSHGEAIPQHDAPSAQVACEEASDAQLAAFEERSQAPADEALVVPNELAREENAPGCVLTDDSYAAGFARQLTEREQTLGHTSSEVGSCEQICDLTASVCKLSERICSLAAKTKSQSIAARCIDGQARCESAKHKASERCGCG